MIDRELILCGKKILLLFFIALPTTIWDLYDRRNLSTLTCLRVPSLGLEVFMLLCENNNFFSIRISNYRDSQFLAHLAFPTQILNGYHRFIPIGIEYSTCTRTGVDLSHFNLSIFALLKWPHVKPLAVTVWFYTWSHQNPYDKQYACMLKVHDHWYAICSTFVI